MLHRTTAAFLALVSIAAACKDGTSPRREGTEHLAGSSSSSGAAAIPRRAFAPRADDYTTTHPDLPGIPISFNTLALTLDPGATVGDVNAVLDDVGGEIVGGIPGIAGAAGGVLVLRAPTRTHAEMEALLARVRARAVVRAAAQDVLLGLTAISRPSTGGPPWLWELQAAGGNWGLEASRVPQMWNLDAAVRKASGSTTVGVVDAGFATSHEDLVYDANAAPAQQHDHGTHVAGIIAAAADNGKGVDGVTPFARLVVWGDTLLGSWAHITLVVDSLVRARTDIRVINMSLGFNWYRGTPPINTVTSPSARAIASQEGAVFAAMLRGLANGGIGLPVIVAAAGNDADPRLGGFPNQDAKFASPMANAALEQGIAAVVVVESDSLPSPGTFNITRSPFSNIGGHVSAPGSQILSTVLGNGYGLQSGTSMASPLVTGLVAYLYALDPSLPRPTLTANLVRDLLVSTAVPVFGGARPRVDAFAAALGVDGVQGGTKVLRRLLDVDDGSADGNRRLTAGGSAELGEDLDGDGGPGDGAVDMSDFRRWRDWLLQAENPAGLALDGAADHPKKDLNRDRLVGTPVEENVYPRGDFNGDGLIHRTITRAMSGALAGQTLTDLQVLQQLFADPDYAASDLPALVSSADVEVSPATCLAISGVATVRSSLRVKGAPVGSVVQPARTHTTGATATRIYTVPVNAAGYTARVEALNAAGVEVAEAEQDFTLALGSDTRWNPVCSGLTVDVVFPTTLTAGAATALDIAVGIRDAVTGNVIPTPNAQIGIIAAGGTVAQATGTTNAQGRFVTSATLAQGNTLLTLLITATAPNGLTLTRSISATGAAAPLTVTPHTATLAPGQTKQYTANQPVIWSAVGGTITQTGLFTAGPTLGGFTITATSAGNATVQQFAGGTVTTAVVGITAAYVGTLTIVQSPTASRVGLTFPVGFIFTDNQELLVCISAAQRTETTTSSIYTNACETLGAAFRRPDLDPVIGGHHVNVTVQTDGTVVPGGRVGSCFIVLPFPVIAGTTPDGVTWATFVQGTGFSGRVDCSITGDEISTFSAARH